MDREICANFIPRVVDILWKLPKPTAGFGLPSVDNAKYKRYSEVRMTLCTIIRDVVEQTPKALLPAIGGFRKKVDDARRKQLISMAEYIVFLEGNTICVLICVIENPCFLFSLHRSIPFHQFLSQSVKFCAVHSCNNSSTTRKPRSSE